MSLAFEPGSDAKTGSDHYAAHGTGFDLELSRRSADIVLSAPAPLDRLHADRASAKIGIEFAGSRRNPRMMAEDRFPAGNSYFVSRDPMNWRSNVPRYGRVRYPSLYRGIDLVFHGNEDHLEYDFLVGSGADPRAIRMCMKGAQRSAIDARGDLVLEAGGQQVRFRKPLAFQGAGLAAKPVDVHYVLNDGDAHAAPSVGFVVGNYDAALPLVIDPVLEYARYVGATTDQVDGVAADNAGSAYVVSGSGADSFTVRKFTPAGDLERSATVGAGDPHVRVQATALAVSASGAVYVAGFAGPGLPAGENAAQAFNDGGTKAFLAVLEPKSDSFRLQYLTYLGGASTSYAYGLVVDSTGAAYLAGDASSGAFPTTRNALQSGYESISNPIAFLCKIDPRVSGSGSMVYATLLGSGGLVRSIATDIAGNVYVVRDADGSIAATAGAFSAPRAREAGNTMEVTKINADGSGILYSANLGSGQGAGIVVDGSGSAYVTGAALQEGLPATSGAYQSQPRGGFIAKLNAAGSELTFVTYLGGSGAVEPRSIAIEPGCISNCTAYVAGVTTAADFPAEHPLQAAAGSFPAIFAVKLAGDGGSADYSTFLGGTAARASVSENGDMSGFIAGPAVAVDGLGFAHIAGNLAASEASRVEDFPVTVLGPVGSAFLARIGDADKAHLVAVPAMVDFGPAVVGGAPASASVELRNMGSAEATLQPVEVAQGNEFESSGNCGDRLAGGARCTLQIRFFPSTGGKRTGTLSIPSSGAGTPLTISMSGLGIEPFATSPLNGGKMRAQTSPRPQLSGNPLATLNPTALAYGNRIVGSAAVTLIATLTNTGTASLSITSVALGGANASQFAFFAPAPAGFCMSSMTLAAGASCTINVKYTPTVLGAATAAVTITDNAASSPQSLPLTATGIANPVPFVQGASPFSATPGSPALSLSLQGAQLASGAVVKWNGASLATTLTSATQATATVPASLLATAGTGTVTVVNPKPTSVVSNPIYVPVASPITALSFNSTLFTPVTVNQPTSPLAIDLNGDFKSDLVVLDALDGNVQAFLNAGSGRLSLKSTTALGATPAAVAAGDFNEDGKLDLAVVSSNGTLSILIGDGAGDFTVSNSFSTGSRGTAIVAGDFNGDGHLDLAVLNSATSLVSVYLGNGAGVFTLASTASVGASPYGMVLADFNRDGYLDLAAGNGDGTVTILLGNGAGGFNPAAPVTTGSAANALLAADFNEDGIPDLAVGGASGTITILSGNGSGGFTTAGSVSQGGPLSSLVAGYFNGNGHVSLAAGSASTSQVALFFGNGKATFSTGPVLTTSAAPTAIAVADFASSGYPGLAVAVKTGNSIQFLFQEPLAVVSPSTVAYLPQLINVPSQPVPLTLTNSGSTGLTVSAMTLTPGSNTGASDFAQTNTCGSLPFTLASGASCTFSFTFTPSKLANEGATFGLTDNSGGASSNQKVLALSGTGVSVYTTTASISSPSIAYGSNAQVVATVSGSNGTPAGNVTLTVGSNAPITLPLTAGTATFNLPGLAASSYHLSLSYAAQGNYGASSASGTLVVNAAATTASIAAPAITYGQAAQIAVSVSAAGVQPSGTVQLTVGSNAPISQSLVSGVATFTIANLTAGSYALAASYAAQGSFSASAASGSQSVSRAVPVITWANPAAIPLGTALGAAQLNAIASVPGSFAYVPAAGTVLAPGPGQTLTVTFTPSDGLDYTTVIGSATINVFSNSIPHLNLVIPSAITPAAAAAGFSLKVTGANLNAGSVVRWNGTALSSTISGLNQVTAQVPAGLVAGPQTGLVTVVNSTPNGVASNAVPIAVTNSSNAMNFNAGPLPPIAVNNPVALAQADFNLDGNRDMAVADATDGTVLVFLGSSSGLETLKATVPVCSGPVALTADDFNGDGKPDLAVLCSSGLVTILLGDGTGNFTALAPVSAGTSGQRIARADFNQDGFLDLAVTNPGSNTVTVLLGTGTGLFVPTSPLTTGTNPSALAVSHFTQDGFVDLAVGNGDGTVSIFLGNGAGGFTLASSPSTGSAVAAVVAGDFNEDGIVDLAIANGSGNVSLLLGVGNGTFTFGPTAAVGANPQAEVAGDFNGDGHLDLAVASPGSGSVSILFGTGSGSFTAASPVPTSVSPVSLLAADFNQDGREDLAVAGSTSNLVTVLLQTPLAVLSTSALSLGNQPQGQATAAQTLTITSGGPLPLLLTSISVVAGTNTGAADFVQSNTCGTLPATLAPGSSCVANVTLNPSNIGAESATLTVIDNSNGVASSSQTVALSGVGTQNPTSTTVSAPAITYGSTAAVTVTVTAQTGTATGNVSLQVGGNAPLIQPLSNGVAVFSLPGLSAGSYALTGSYSQQGSFLASGAAGTLVVSQAQPVLQWVKPSSIPTAVALSSVQLDATSSVPGMFTYSPGAGAILGIGTNQNLYATFTPTDTVDYASALISTTINVTANPVPYLNPVIPAVVSPAQASAGFILNLTGTGFVPTSAISLYGTALASTLTGSTSLAVTVPPNLITGPGLSLIKVSNPETGKGGLSNTLLLPTTSPFSSLTFGTGSGAPLPVNQPTSVATGQFDASGNQDLAIVDTLDGNVQIYLGNGAGVFTYYVSVSAGQNPVWVTTGDFNEDGLIDLAVVDANGTVEILKGNGKGYFSAMTTFSAGKSGQFIAAADLNLDGHLDLAVVNPLSDTVTVFTGLGNGTFTEAAVLPTGLNPYGLSIADYNLDGFPDLAIGGGDGTVFVYLGSANGTFSLISSPTTGSAATAMATGDFNEDGIPDLAVVNSSGNVTVLTGSGNGSFATSSTTPVGSGPQAIAVGDLNGDGHLDLAIANQTGGNVSVLLGAGNGAFTPQPAVATGGSPAALTIDDFNNDGREDLAVANNAGNSVGIYFQIPIAALSLTSMNFGTPAAGIATTAQTTTLTNSGSAQLNIASIAVVPGTNAGANDFIQTNTCGSVPAVLAPGASCTISVTLSASSASAESATLIVTDNANLVTGSAQTVALSDNSAIFSPTQTTMVPGPSIIFGATASATVSVTSPNGTPGGNAMLSIDGFPAISKPLSNGTVVFSLTGLKAGTHSLLATYGNQGNFGLSSASGSIAVSQATATISWAAPAAITAGTPLSAVQLNATSSVAGSLVYNPAAGTVLGVGNNQPLSVSFVPVDAVDYASAIGAATVSVLAPPSTVYVLPASITFNNQTDGFSSPLQTVTLFNASSSSITIKNLSIGGTSYALYSAFTLVTGTNSCAATASIAVGGSCVANIQFKPTTAGAFAGTLSINYTVGTSTKTTTVTATLAGTGLATPIPLLQPVIPAAVLPSTANAGFTLQIPGAGFTASSVVSLGGTALATHLVTNNGATKLSATVPAGMISTQATGILSVTNAKPTGLISNPGYVSYTVPLALPHFSLGPFTAETVNQPIAILAQDINGDHIPDLVVLDGLDGTVLAYTGAGSGRVALVSTTPVGANPVGIVAGDFNEDGKLDLAVASANGNVTILMGNGSGSYTAQTPFSAGSSAQSISAADLNGDGHWDLVVTNPSAGTATVLFGAGNATFTLSQTLAAGASPYGVAIADFNLDQIPDLAVGNADGTVSIFLGSANGTFLPASAPVTGYSANSIVSGDFNEDGIPDLAVINTNNTVSILTGNGTGLFTLGAQSAVGNSPQGLIVADLNGDGHLDLAVANTTDNTVSILYGTGTGSFNPQAVMAVAAGPLSLGAVDMNNDGRTDLTVASGVAKSMSVLIQNPLISISASTVAFGSQLYGTTSASQTFTVANTGSGPLSVLTLGIAGGYDSSDFGMTTTCATPPMIINPQASCTVTVNYTPSRVGGESATFTVLDNSDSVGGAVQYVSLTGTGLAVPTSLSLSSVSSIVFGAAAQVSLAISTPTTIPNGYVTLGVGGNAPLTGYLTTAGTVNFTLTGLPVGTYNLVANYPTQTWYAASQTTGTLTVQPAYPVVNWNAPAAITQGTPLTSLQLNATSTVAGSFVYSPPLSTVLPAGNSQKLTVTFTPTDTVDYATAIASTTISVVPPSSSLVVTVPSLTFGYQRMGTASASQTSTLINTGTTPIALSAISLSGPNPSSFQFVSPTPSTSCLSVGGTLAAGASCTLDVVFAPSSAGTVSASVLIPNNSGTGQQSVALSGIGVYSPAPFVEKVTPTALTPAVAGAGFTINLLGTGFVPGATIEINGKAVATTVSSGTALQALVPAGLLTTPQTAMITVLNPGPGGENLSNQMAVSVNTPSAVVTIGAGPFAPLPVNSPQGVVVADFNGDGIPDIAVADSVDGEVLVYVGSSSGGFTLNTTLNVGLGAVSIAVGDFNEDHRLDLAVLASTGSISLWLGDGTGNFALGATVSSGSSGSFLIAADFDGDGHLDLAAVNPVTQNVGILLGTGTGTFNYTSTLTTGVAPYGIALADFNQDGILDMAVGNADGSVSVFLGNGNGTFSMSTFFESGAPGTALVTGDFNEDGIPDIAVATTGASGVGTNGSVTIWTGKGNGLFVQGNSVPVGSNPDALAVADFNGDGHLDIAVANQYGGTVQFLVGTGAAKFVASAGQASGSGPLQLAVADFNNDGRIDVVSVDSTANAMTVLLQIPQASISTPTVTFPTQAIATPSAPMSFTVTNSGSATAPLVISGINITPAYNTAANDFTWTTYCGTLPASLAPGNSCTVNVTFSPSYVAVENAVLTVTDNSGGVAGSTQTVALSGTAPLPTNILATSQVNVAPYMAIPSNFLGLSFDWDTAESWMGSTVTGADPIFQQLLSNLMAYNSGPLVIRIAGDSVDTGTINASTVVPFAQLAQNMNVHYILGVNLDLNSVSLAESQAAAYAAGVPNNSIDAFEIGNEPDNYLSGGARGEPYGVAPYLVQQNAWQQGISQAVPTLQRFADPALAGSAWLSGMETADLAGQLNANIITQHSYIACKNTANPWPTNLLLQPYATTSAPKLYGPYATIAHQMGQKFRMGEMNSICSGGQPGLSNNFTTALWSVDTMFAYVNAGIDGVNWHTSSGSSYNAFNFTVTTKSGVNQFTLSQVNPLYYGLLMFAQAAGNGAQLLPVTTLTNANLDVWATLDNSGTVHVVIINKDQVANGTLQFSVPGYSSGTAIPLTAASYTSTTGVTFGGQTFDGSKTGAIQGTQATQAVSAVNGVFSVSVNPTSALLINLTH